MAAGSIVIDLLMKTGAFETDTKRAEKRLKDFEKTAKAWGAAIGTAAVAAGAAFAAWTVKVAETGKELDRFATLTNTSAETFQKWAYGAKSVGIEQEKLSDILKDVQDRVGDFVTTGGGPMLDFFEQIAPKIGLTAEQFRNLSGPEALGLYVSSLEKAGLSQSEMIFYMEAMASDSSLLIPLLKDNASGMAAMGAEAERLGAVMSNETVAAAKELDQNLQMLTGMVGGFSTSLANEVVPTLNNFISGLINAETSSGDLSAAMKDMVRDTGLVSFLEAGMVGMARVADVAVFLGKSISIIAQSFRAVAADAEVAYRAMAKIQIHNWFDDEASADLSGAVQRRNQIVGSFNAALDDIVSYQGNRFEQAALNAIDRAQVNRDFGYAGLLADRPVPMLGENVVTSGASGVDKNTKARVDKTREYVADSMDELLIRMGELSEPIDGLAVRFGESSDKMGEFAVQAARNIQSSLGDGLYNILKGNFSDIGQSFGDMITRMVADAAAANLAQALFGNYGSSGQIGGILGNIAGSLFGGASSGNLTGSSLSGATWGPTYSFAGGGYTGAGGKYDPAGIVHAGEFVLRQEAVKRIGIPRLEAMNRGYADGGLVGGMPSGGAAGSPIINVTNKGTPQTVESANAQFDGGQWVINVVLSDINNNGQLGRFFRNNGMM